MVPIIFKLINILDVLYYEGPVKDFLKDGQGKEYHENGKLKYEGSFVDDKYNDWKA